MNFEPHEIEAIAEAVFEQICANKELVLDSKPEPIGLNEKDAAESLGVKPHVLRDAKLRGEIHGRKIGKTTVYSRQSLVDWIEKK